MSAANGGVTVRTMKPSDAPAVWSMILEFAAFEGMLHQGTGSAERLARHLEGGAWPPIDGLVAERDGALAGYAIFYGAFSTFWTRPLFWLEDLFVPERERGHGVGKALLAAVARIAIERGSPRIDWAVLNWNSAAMGFYERLGAKRSGGWLPYRLEGEALEKLAAEATDEQQASRS